MIELVKTVLKVNVFGKEVELSEPSMKTLQEFQGKIGDDKVDDVNVMLDFLAKCGMEREISEELSPNHIAQIMEALVPKKD